jgi:hypothetical protein
LIRIEDYLGMVDAPRAYLELGRSTAGAFFPLCCSLSAEGGCPPFRTGIVEKFRLTCARIFRLAPLLDGNGGLQLTDEDAADEKNRHGCRGCECQWQIQGFCVKIGVGRKIGMIAVCQPFMGLIVVIRSNTSNHPHQLRG